jgi:hypothetical protein
MNLRLALPALTAVAFLGAADCARASVTFADTTFDLSGYALASYQNNPATTFTAAQCAACGNNSPQALAITTSFPAGGALTIGFINTAFVYDPTTQGAIDSLFAFVSKDLTTSLPGSTGNAFRPLIQQGGSYYMATINGASVIGPTTTGFRDFFGILSAASFNRYDFGTGAFLAGNPNFTAGAMRFGLAQFSANLPAGTDSSIRYDTLFFDITSTPPLAAAVPEPATWAVMIAGFGLTGATLRRRRAVLAA